jgi:hypothetical protein
VARLKRGLEVPARTRSEGAVGDVFVEV